MNSLFPSPLHWPTYKIDDIRPHQWYLCFHAHATNYDALIEVNDGIGIEVKLLYFMVTQITNPAYLH